MQIRARISLEIAEWRCAFVDPLRVREFAGVGDALVVVDGERLQAQSRRQRKMASESQHAREPVGNERDEASGSQRPGEACGKPESQRRRDQIGWDEHIHRQEKDETAQTRARQIGEIDASERAVAFEEDAAEEDRARQERRQLRQEHLQKLPLLRRVGNDEYGVEAELLDIEIGADRERPEEPERDRRRAAPMSRKPVLGYGHDRAGEPEAEHGEAHDQRAEMRPAPHREDAHDVDLERDHRPSAEPDCEIEADAFARAQRRIAARVFGARAPDDGVGGRNGPGFVHALFLDSGQLRRNRRSVGTELRPTGEQRIAVSCCACRRSDRLRA